MFRSAATKIAHNTTLPVLSSQINKDLRSLQELITAEKGILLTLQKLSNDFAKSSECLRAWGAGEGDDLADTLSASTTLLMFLSTALSQFASHEATVREQMKAVRSREENLDELRRRRRNVVSKADAAEKKLSKMGPEHKNLSSQMELLNTLRDQIRSLDWEILTEEAKLGDFKRTSAKNWMMLKFGGLLECAEKASAIGEIGRLIIEEIPLDFTQPGQARAVYTGHEKTSKLVTEAQRCVSEIVFDPQHISESAIQSHMNVNAPSRVRDRERNSLDQQLPEQGQRYSPPLQQVPPLRLDNYGHVDTESSVQYTPNTISYSSGRLYDEDRPNEFGVSSPGSRSQFSQTLPAHPGERRYDEPPSQFAPPARGTSRFAAFPTRERNFSASSGTGAQAPSQLDVKLGDDFSQSGQDGSLSAEIASALSKSPGFSESAYTPGATSTSGTAVGTYSDEPGSAPGDWDKDVPAPRYEYVPSPSIGSSPLPPGAAAPYSQPSPHQRWDDEETEVSETPNPFTAHGEDDGSELPYSAVTDDRLNDHRMSRHVRWEGRESGNSLGLAANTYNGNPEKGNELDELTESEISPSDFPPTPSTGDVTDEDALNAAASREVARELDSLNFSPPPPTDRSLSPLVPPAPPFAGKAPVAPVEKVSFPGAERAFKTVDSRQPPTQSVPSSPVTPASSGPRPQLRVTSESSSFASASTGGYATPGEYPGTSTPTRLNPAFSPPLSAATPTATGGGRTISAAAFKRPQARSTTSLPGIGALSSQRPAAFPDISPLTVKKRPLPTSPYPSNVNRVPVPSFNAAETSAATPTQHYPHDEYDNSRRSGDTILPPYDEDPNVPLTPPPSKSALLGVGVGSPRTPHSAATSNGTEFDFIASYQDGVSDAGGSPRVENEAGGRGPESPPGQGQGYSQGRFATNLDGNDLR